MFESLRLSADARDLSVGFDGASPARPTTTALLRLANDLATAATFPSTARATESARLALRQAILAESARRRSHPGPAARARTAVVGVAAVAGAGLIVASAANGTDPVTVVRQAVGAIPYASDASLPATVAVTLDGVVVAGAENHEFAVSVAGNITQVRISPATVIRDAAENVVTSDALVRGTAVRLAGVRRGDAVLASTIVVRTAPAPATTASPAAEPTPISNANAAPRPGVAASLSPSNDLPTPTAPSRTLSTAGAVSPRPAAVVKPTATATPTETSATAMRPVSSSNAAPTPTPSPSRTPAPVTSSVQDAQSAPRPSAKSQLTP